MHMHQVRSTGSHPVDLLRALRGLHAWIHPHGADVWTRSLRATATRTSMDSRVIARRSRRAGIRVELRVRCERIFA